MIIDIYDHKQIPFALLCFSFLICSRNKQLKARIVIVATAVATKSRTKSRQFRYLLLLVKQQLARQLALEMAQKNALP